MIKLIASDMDGTLLDENKNFPPDFFDVLKRLEKNDIRFIVASGRSYRALEPLFNEHADRMTFICDNGAYIVRDGNTEFVSSIPAETVTEIIKTCHKKLPSVYPVLCGNNGIYVTDHFKGNSAKELGFYYNSRILLDNPEELDDTIFKIALYDEKNPAEYSFPVLNEIFGSYLTLQVSGHLWMDIMNPGINKGTALEKIQKSLGVSPEETMAFGDFYNDVELLKRAGYSYVMANANEDMKKYGKYTADSNENYGVTKAVTEYLDRHNLA